MTSDPSPRSDAARQLGALAMHFRRTRDAAARRALATEYAREVQRLIETGDWSEAPAFEDQLPVEWMPEAFFAYWVPGPDALTRCEEVVSVPKSCRRPEESS